jgi:O-antigen/teichoic acid export membrane protein
MTANLIVQVVGIALYPIVTRLYSPETVGALSLFLAIVGIFTTIASGRYEQAIVAERNNQHASGLIHLCLILTLVTGLIIAIAERCIGGSTIADMLKTPILADYLWLVAPLVVLSALGYMLTFVFNRQDMFQLTACYTATQGIVGNVLRVLFGFVGMLSSGLYWANIVGHVAGLLSVAWRIPSITRLTTDNRESKMTLVIKAMRRHWRYPAFNLPHALISTVSNNLPIMILALAYPTESVGFFALCVTFGYKPVNVFALSMNQALFQTASVATNSGKSNFRHFVNFTLRTSLVATPIVVVLYIIMPTVTPVLFGDEWSGSTEIMRALLPLLLLTTLSTPFNFVPLLHNRQATALAIETTSSVCRIAVLIIGSQTTDITTTTVWFALTHSLFLAIQLVWYLSLEKR